MGGALFLKRRIMMRTKPEILAPAGSLDGLKAAVAAGCDAIYIGGSQFGARAYAQNTEQDEMLEAIHYCHLHQVKIYMTVNTILKNREIKESLFSFLRPYYEAGLDAVIVQDMGVLRFVEHHFPGLEIHASTQMTLTMGKSAEYLRKHHVTRIVPARELTLEELEQMRKETSLELEVFVHGALCYCYSGQCLFSSMLGGRSGNRGRCAQPCRMPYQGSYLLSPKELCNLPYLPEMIEAGIDSFKIEGRMKRPEYTAFVTAMYRKYTDLYMDMGKKKYREYLKKHKKEWEEDLRCLAELYNRNGFTQGYLEGKAGYMDKRHPQKKTDMLANLRPKHGGVCVGKVLSVGKGEVVYQTSRHISAQDVVEFRNEKQQPSYEYTLGSDVQAGRRVTARYQKGSRIHIGDYVYRTKDAHLLEQIREQYIGVRKQVEVTGYLEAICGKPLRLVVVGQWSRTKKAITVECISDICQEAQKQPMEKEAIQKVLNQTGNSAFCFQSLKITVSGNVFLPVGTLKKLRREAFEKLDKQLHMVYRRSDTQPLSEEFTQDMNLDEEKQEDSTVTADSRAASVMTEEQLDGALSAQGSVNRIYIRTELMTAKQIIQSFAKVHGQKKEAWIELPMIFRSSVWRLFEKEWQKEEGIFSLPWDGFLVKNIESLLFLTQVVQVKPQKIRLEHNMYVMNDEAAAYWKEQSISKFTAPLEATYQELKQMKSLPQMELLVYGRIPLMVSAQCVQANTRQCVVSDGKENGKSLPFTDQKKRTFMAVNYCKYCYNVIYQKEPLYLGKELKQKKLLASGARYSFTTEAKEQVRQILSGNISEKTQTGHFEQGIQ